MITSAPRRIENSMPLIRSPTVKPPSVEARTAISLVVPATPLPPLPLPSSAEISPLTKVPCPTMSVTSAPPELVSNTRATWPANSGWFTSRPVSITDTIRARAAADRGERLTGAHRVVRPGELDGRRAARGVDDVEGIRPPPAGCDRARCRPRAGRRAARRRPPRPRHRGRQRSDRREQLGLGAQAADPRRQTREVGMRARADQQALRPARSSRYAPARRVRRRPMRSPARAAAAAARRRSLRAGSDCRAWRRASRSSIPVEACADAARSGAAQRKVASTALRTWIILGTARAPR